MARSRKKPSNLNQKDSKRPNNYLKYSGLAFQMALTIGIMGYLGWKIDHWINLDFPWVFLLFVFIGFAGSFYLLVKGMNKNQD